ncbi:MAG: DUF4396 domain-containing protein [Thermoleophilaceae bacterium]|nr:DUF4396 domain-containing protein [Thermoleophilaceae bacterium]
MIGTALGFSDWGTVALAVALAFLFGYSLTSLFWGALSFALVVAGAVAWPVNRWLITRGRGHAVLHDSGHHPDVPIRLVVVVVVAMAIFGTTVLVVDTVSG